MWILAALLEMTEHFHAVQIFLPSSKCSTHEQEQNLHTIKLHKSTFLFKSIYGSTFPCKACAHLELPLV